MSLSNHIPASQFSRRRLLQGAACCLGAQPLLFGMTAFAGNPDDERLNGRVYKTLKYGMANKLPGSMTEKFASIRAVGFQGVELGTSKVDIPGTRKAVADTGLLVDGTVCSSHWSIRHTSHDKEERAQALKDLKQAIRDTHAIGGHTVLLVVGHGKDGSEEELWDRSIENIAQAVPLAAELGIVIAIENVWNHFLYDHEGDSTQTAEKYARYVDEFNSPWVGMQFDVGNHWKYGSMGDWIRTLGKRIVKLDVKGFSRKDSQFTKIGEGDVDWADVRRALVEIGFYGWAAAEVAGGGLERLQEVSNNLDKVFALA
ncbi:MAG: sugar phosphate isomerase/epimerase [Pirellulaceae bacterium]|nr:sugar phosphate isomerase/epimerase [Pirellulaceae bacterium]